MDPLSDVLSLLKPRSYVASGFDAGAPWAVQYAGHEGIKCYALVSGACWLTVDGVPEAARLATGDCFLLASGRSFRLGSDLVTAPVDAVALYKGKRLGGVVSHNGGGDFFLVGSHFLLSGPHAGILLGLLPPIVHIRQPSDQAAWLWSLERMSDELRERQPGGFLIAEHLAHMILIQALRQHLTEASSGGVGWLFALADKQMGAAIGAMHENPAHDWTLLALAERAGMSRSTFALKFKRTVGWSPIDYLAHWRMLLAGDRLTNSRKSVSAIALSLGYESESAFSTAFKRMMGCSPRQYGRDRRLVPSSPGGREGGGVERLELVAG